MMEQLFILAVVVIGKLAIILGFNVSCTKSTAALMKQREVTLIAHNVIYKLIELLKVLGVSYVHYFFCDPVFF